jgi:DNA-binding NtrC family response regulator
MKTVEIAEATSPLADYIPGVRTEPLVAALAQCNNHRERAVAILGISVRTLRYKMNRYSPQ